MTKQEYVNDFYAAIAKGVPQSKSNSLREEFGEIAKRLSDVPESEFKKAFSKEVEPFMAVYGKMATDKELGSIKTYISIFFFAWIIGSILFALIAK
jgi:hypothetical protein